ncbi:hypothetical protein GCM10028817_41440 [Spirosoma pomorum]
MKKAQTSLGSRSNAQRSFSAVPQVSSASSVLKVAAGVSVKRSAGAMNTIDFRQLAKAAAAIHCQKANQSKTSASSGGRIIKPSGLFNR